jgi:DNA-binding NarL/FixJ family response regulator
VEAITPAAAGEPVVARPTREAIVARVARDPVADDVARAPCSCRRAPIRNHVAALTHKLGARSRADAYRIARDNGSI